MNNYIVDSCQTSLESYNSSSYVQFWFPYCACDVEPHGWTCEQGRSFAQDRCV